MACTTSILASPPLAQSCPRVFTPATTPTLQTRTMISFRDRVSPESFCRRRVYIGAMFTSLASLSIDIKLIATCSPPTLPPLMIRTIPGPEMGVMSVVREIGGDVNIMGESKPVVVVVPCLSSLSMPSTPRSNTHAPHHQNAAIHAPTMLPFDSGCPELHPPTLGDGVFHGKLSDRDASAIGEIDLQFSTTLRLVI